MLQSSPHCGASNPVILNSDEVQSKQSSPQSLKLPPGFMDKFFKHLHAAPGGEEISPHLIRSLYYLDSTNNTQDKLGYVKPFNFTPNEVISLQDFIFSNITKNIPLQPLISNPRMIMQLEDKLLGLESLSLDLSHYIYENVTRCNDFQKAQVFLPKMNNLKSLHISFEATGDMKTPWHPFSSMTEPLLLSTLEHLSLSVRDFMNKGPLDYMGIVKTFLTLSSFPNLKTIKLPNHFYSSSDRDLIRLLLKLLSLMPKLINFFENDYFQYLSQEFIEELLQSPALSKIEKLCFAHGHSISPSHRYPLLSSPYLTSVTELNLGYLFKDEKDLEEISEWLFQKDWMKNLVSLSLPFCSSRTAHHLITSPHLVNLTTLHIQGNEEVYNIILQSPQLCRKVKALGLVCTKPNHITTITTSPHFSNLEEFSDYTSPPSLLSSLAASSTLKSFKKLMLHSIVPKDDSETRTNGLVAFFQSPILQNFTLIDMHISQLPFEAFLALVSSPYVTNITQICFRRQDLQASQWIDLFLSNPAWSNLTTLELSYCNLEDNHIKLIGESQYLTKLTSLTISKNPLLTDKALTYVSQSPNFRNLAFLDTRGKAFSAKALIQLFKSPHINQMGNLNVSFCRNAEKAIQYLIDNPNLFSNDGFLYETLPTCTFSCDQSICRSPKRELMRKYTQMAYKTPFQLLFNDEGDMSSSAESSGTSSGDDDDEAEDHDEE